MKYGTTTDFDFVRARLQGMKSRLVEGQDLWKLSQTKSPLEIGRLLMPPIEERVPDQIVFKKVEIHLRQMRHLMLQLSPAHCESVSSLLSWYDLMNVKVLLRAMEKERPLWEVIDLLGPWWSPPPLLTEQNFFETKPQSIGSLLPKGPDRDILIGNSTEKDWQSLESNLDLAYFQNVAQHVPVRVEDGVALCQLEADVHNIQVLVRGRLWYDIEISKLDAFWTPHGGIPLKTLKDLPSPDPLDAFLEALPRPFRCKREGLVQLEDHLWETVWKAAKKTFLSPKNSFSRVIAFCYLKRFEATNMIRLCQGVEDGLDPQEITSRLLGASSTEETISC